MVRKCCSPALLQSSHCRKCIAANAVPDSVCYCTTQRHPILLLETTDVTSNIKRNMAISPPNNLPPAHEPQFNELQQIKNCNPCANGHGIFVSLHYGDLMQTEGAFKSPFL